MAIEKVYKDNAWDEVNSSHTIVEASSNTQVSVGANSWSEGLSVNLSKGKWIVTSIQYFTGGSATAKFDLIVGQTTGNYCSRDALTMPSGAFCVSQAGIIEVTSSSVTVKQHLYMTAAVTRSQALLRAVKL